MIKSNTQKVTRCNFNILVIGFLFLVLSGAIVSNVSAEPVVSPINDDDLHNSINKIEIDIEPDYDSCAMTAYGEPLYLDDSPVGFTSVAEMDTQYLRARMAFLFGNYEYAYKIWEPLAYKGHAKSQATLAWMFHTGKGVHKNLKRALSWYRVAADNDQPIAQNNLGVFYEQGVEVGKSYRTAANWYKKAAEVGYGYAQYNLGVLYLNGKGVKKNPDQAIYWLQIASLQGVKQASALLEDLGKQSAPRDKIHKTQPKKKYHNAALPAAKPTTTSSTHTEETANNKILNESWITAQNPENFTLQVAGSDNLSSLLAFAQSIATSKNQLAYYELSIKGKRWFNLISGSFKDPASAKKALDNLPDNLKEWSPEVRKFSDLQKIVIAH